MLIASRVRLTLLAALVAAPLEAQSARANDCAELHARLPELRAARARHEAALESTTSYQTLRALADSTIREASSDLDKAKLAGDKTKTAMEEKILAQMTEWRNELVRGSQQDFHVKLEALRQTEEELFRVQRELTNQDCYSRKNRPVPRTAAPTASPAPEYLPVPRRSAPGPTTIYTPNIAPTDHKRTRTTTRGPVVRITPQRATVIRVAPRTPASRIVPRTVVRQPAIVRTVPRTVVRQPAIVRQPPPRIQANCRMSSANCRRR
jgi:hypothetical protein